jgi:hypothetical protein
MHQHWARIKQIIETEGEIHKYDLIEKTRISLSTYDKLKPWILYKFQEFVSYDKETKIWRWEI